MAIICAGMMGPEPGILGHISNTFDLLFSPQILHICVTDRAT